MTLTPQKSVLVVEDEPDVRGFLAGCLDNMGFIVKVAIDGLDALDKIKEKTPDLILLDMVMPRRSGTNLVRKLYQNENWKKIPVIFIVDNKQSGFGNEEGELEAEALYKYVLEKPIASNRLADAVNKILCVF